LKGFDAFAARSYKMFLLYHNFWQYPRFFHPKILPYFDIKTSSAPGERAIFPSLQTYFNIVLYTLDEGIFYNFL